MGPHQVDISLGDGAHTDLVIGSGQESSECAGKSNRTVTGGTADGNSYLQQQGRHQQYKFILTTEALSLKLLTNDKQFPEAQIIMLENE